MSTPTPAVSEAFFRPIDIRGLHAANRFVMSPMTQMVSPDHIPGRTTVEHYRSRAAGGTGIVVTEGIGVDHPASVDHHAIPRLDGAESVSAWREVTDAVHADGAPIIAQLWHVGPLWGANAVFDPGYREQWDAVRPMRPSGLWGTPGVVSYEQEFVDRWDEPIDPMTEEEIRQTLAAYARSAALAMEAGFDGVEIHGGHGYLPDAFVWHDTNRRTDSWGGDLAARCRYPVELVRGVREAIGEQAALFYRFSQHTQQDYKSRKGDDPEELGVYLNALVDAGVDVLDASARRFDAPTFPELDGEDGALSLAGWARRLTGAPSMAVGGIGIATTLREQNEGRRVEVDGDPMASVDLAAEMALAGQFDLLAVGRMLLRQPDFVDRIGGVDTPTDPEPS